MLRKFSVVSPPPTISAYLSTVTVKYPEYRRMALVDDVCEHLEAVLHVISPPLYGVHGYVVVLELPRLRELCIQDVQASQTIILHHLRHLPLHHLHGIPAGFDDGLHLVGVEEIAPQRQADAQQEQRLRPEEKITHDPTQKRQKRHCVSYHHTQTNCSRFLPSSAQFTPSATRNSTEIDSLPRNRAAFPGLKCISQARLRVRLDLRTMGGWLPGTGPRGAEQKRAGHLHRHGWMFLSYLRLSEQLQVDCLS